MTYKKYLTATLIALPLLGCTDSADEPQPEPTQTAISFAHTIEAAAEADGTSRAAVTEKEDMLSFCVYAQLFEYKDWNWNYKTYMISDERVIPTKKDNTWVTENLYYWPGKDLGLRFFAYSPDKAEGIRFINPDGDWYNQQFFYEPPTDPRKQVDLMFAKTGHTTPPINYGEEPGRKVQMTFYHRLFQVNFEVNGDASQLSTITLKNIVKNGIFHLLDNRWEVNYDDSNKTSYTVNVPTDGNFGDDHRLMIIPQLTPHNCTLEISFRDGSSRSIPFAFKFKGETSGGYVYRIVINLENSAAEDGGESS